MSRPLRILVTGSRHWTDTETVASAIGDALTFAGIGLPVLVHGGAPGADSIADDVWRSLIQHGMDIAPPEVHPADWEQHGRAAGPIRNAHMVSLGATFCLAFPLGASPGTRGCMALAKAAGISVRAFAPAVAA